MNKKFVLCVLSVILALPTEGAAAYLDRQPDNPAGHMFTRRALFVSVIQDPPALSSREQIAGVVDFAVRARIGTLFVQIYRANKAWFPSKIGDPGPYETCLKRVGEDPLAFLIRRAHAAGIEVHAWLNMLSLSTNEEAPLLKKYGRDILTKNLKDKNKLRDFLIDDQYFLEPGDLRVRQELSNLVGEILRAYPDLDGIQFDYIRYPDKNPAYGFTKMNVARFKKETGIAVIEERSQVWKDWKRDQVTGLLEQLVKKVRVLRPDIRVSTTGCTPYSRAYHEAFQNWPAWIERGLVDFVTIMSYSPDTSEFAKYVSDAQKRTADFKKVNVGIGAYEMVRSPEVFARQFRLCQSSGAGACVFFHYGSMLQNTALADSLTGPAKSGSPSR